MITSTRRNNGNFGSRRTAGAATPRAAGSSCTAGTPTLFTARRGLTADRFATDIITAGRTFPANDGIPAVFTASRRRFTAGTASFSTLFCRWNQAARAGTRTGSARSFTASPSGITATD